MCDRKKDIGKKDIGKNGRMAFVDLRRMGKQSVFVDNSLHDTNRSVYFMSAPRAVQILRGYCISLADSENGLDMALQKLKVSPSRKGTIPLYSFKCKA